jgi:hypothetical protein
VEFSSLISCVSLAWQWGRQRGLVRRWTCDLVVAKACAFRQSIFSPPQTAAAGPTDGTT